MMPRSSATRNGNMNAASTSTAPRSSRPRERRVFGSDRRTRRFIARYMLPSVPHRAVARRPDTTTTTLPALGTTTPRSTTTTSPNPGATVDGPIATNEWGDVQVRVTLSGRRIIDVQALRLPHDNSHSAALSREAAPVLRREALEAQSSQIDVVSGATLTSESYVESLQGALDRAGH